MSALDKLIAAHPALFRGAPPRVPGELPDGWYGLADELCCAIESMLGPVDCAAFEVVQVKEKYGALRFYFALGGAKDHFVDVHTGTGLRTFVKRAEGPPKMDAVRQLIEMAADGSASACQTCGAPGQRLAQDGRVATLCKQHRKA